MDDRVYFNPGEVVTLKQDVPDKPIMIVKSIDKAEIAGKDGRPVFLGVTCIWFTTARLFQCQRFNSKDLVSCESN